MEGRRTLKNERGYVLVSVLFVVALVLLVTGNMLHLSTADAKTRAVVNKQADYYYEVEETLNNVVGWLQTNSPYLVDAFSEANFDSNFDLGAPSLGDNEGLHFGIHSMVKMAGTNSSVMLSNNNFFGTPAFPAVNHIVNGTAFNAITEFQNANLGPANARVILIWARETDGNYEPIFRIDVITGNNPDRGVHSFSYVYSSLVTANSTEMGFYGELALLFNTPNNDCYSYVYSYNAGVWDKGAPRANCPIASDGDIDISSKIYGDAFTNAANGINLNPPGGNVSGDTCSGPGCHGYSLPPLSPYDVYCPSGGPDVNASVDTDLSTGGCYGNVTIANNKTLILSDNTQPYYFKDISYSGNNSTMTFVPGGETEFIELYAVNLSDNDHINGNRWVNEGNAPHQLKMNYLGTDELTLNGTADMNAFLTAPFAPVVVQGNFNYYGGILAKQLEINGNARVNFQEGAESAVPALVDMTLSLRKASQRYR